jgi:hypothetical protein
LIVQSVPLKNTSPEVSLIAGGSFAISCGLAFFGADFSDSRVCEITIDGTNRAKRNINILKKENNDDLGKLFILFI